MLRWSLPARITASNSPRAILWAVGSIALVALVIVLSEPGKVVNGLFLGSMIALGAIGLSLIYNILRFAHIAHGDYMTLGAYVTYFLLTVIFPRIGIEGQGFGPFTFGYPLLIALPIAIVAVIAVAIALDFLIYRRLREKGSSLVILAMTSLGVAIALRGLVQMIWGTSPEQFPRQTRQFFILAFDIRIPPDSLFLGAVAIILIVALYLFLNRTKMGKAMRATADNPELAMITGINTQRVIYWTWAIAAGYAATAGILLAVSQAQLLPIIGWNILIPIFAAVILGGIGSPWGALVGALVVGISMEASTEWVSPAYKTAVAFTIMLVILLVRPKGIVGGKG